MTANHEILRKLDASEPLTPVETYKVGLAILSILQGPLVDQDELGPSPDQRTELLSDSVKTLISSLRLIREDTRLSEREKLHSGAQVLSTVDFDKLPDPELKNELFGQAMLNIIAGSRPLITKRVGEVKNDWDDKILQQAALVRLGDRVNTLNPKAQLMFLSTDLQTVEALDDEVKKNILVAWAKSRIKQGASEKEVSGMVKFFFDQEDNASVSEITTAYLKP